MTDKQSELTKAEWVVMKCCWSKGRCTARQVHEQTGKQRKWQYQTVKTMLDRLVHKGYVKVEKVGPVCVYVPTVSRAKASAQAMESFVGTVLDGTVAPLFAHLAKGRKLSGEELASLKRLIDERDEEGDG